MRSHIPGESELNSTVNTAQQSHEPASREGRPDSFKSRHSGVVPDLRRVDNVEALGALASADRVWARAAAIHRSGEWQASSLDLVTGCEPPAWRPEVWRYDEVVFVAEQTDGAAASAWLTSGSADLAGLQIRLPEVQPTLSRHHLASLQRYTYAPSIGRASRTSWASGLTTRTHLSHLSDMEFPRSSVTRRRRQPSSALSS